MKRPYFIHFKDNAPTAFMKELEGERENCCEDSRHDDGDRATGVEGHGSDLRVDGRSSDLKVEGRGRDPRVDGVYENILSGRMLTMAGLFDICEREEVGAWHKSHIYQGLYL